MARTAAVAYHIALQGLANEVVLLEQDRFVLIFAYLSYNSENMSNFHL